ncbi:MAG: CpXC domain-containing protein [Gemmataceae bacterium]|nr:CpXC domain-containing protein [Gemmataceae bacterium]
MSVFNTTEMACPACGAAVTFQLVHSVNAVRRPDLRVAILDRSFQRQPCPSCGTSFRVEPEFTYLDIKRKQFLAVWPASKLAQWQEVEARSQASYDKAFGPGTDGAALAAGGMLARCVFGWLGLNEKLIAAEHGIDDVELEMAKLATLRELGDIKLGADREFRLVGATDDELAVGWLRTSTEDIDDEYSVPRQLLNDIHAEPEKWASLRADVSGGMFVDYRRLLFAKE